MYQLRNLITVKVLIQETKSLKEINVNLNNSNYQDLYQVY